MFYDLIILHSQEPVELQYFFKYSCALYQLTNDQVTL